MNTLQFCACFFIMVCFSACQPSLYMPATPNTPFVDTANRTDVKAGFSFRHIELQANRLIDSNRIVQVQLAQRFANNFRGGRYEVGFGKMNLVNSSMSRYTIWGIGYSFTSDLNRMGFGSEDWLSTQQIPLYGQFGLIKSLKSKRLSFSFRPSVVYVPYARLQRPFHTFDGRNFRRFQHVFYSVLDLSSSIRIGAFNMTLGSKFPAMTSHSLLKEFLLVEEIVYLRLTFNLTKFD